MAETTRVTSVLAQARLERKLTQQQVADRLGITRQAVSQMEDPTADPRLSTLMRWADALDMNITCQPLPRPTSKGNRT